MRCYKHPKEEAVGMCKVCNKGLCEACAVEEDGFLFCKQHSEMPEVVEKAEEDALAMMPKPARAAPVAVLAPKAKPRPAAPPKALLRVTPSASLAPALVGAIVSGVLMGLPFVNIPCIVWMVLGGAVAAYFLVAYESSKEGVRGYIRLSHGTEIGAVSGLFGASIAMVISLFVAVNFGDLIAQGMASASITDPATASLFAQMVTTNPDLNVTSMLVKYFVMLVAFPIFGAIGGALAARISR